ncbi:uncharacterized protein LOC144340542 isoform X5 [Macaca mulatta]
MKLTVSGQVFLEVGFRDRGDQRPELLCPNGIARFFDADRKGPGPGAYNLTQTCFAQKGRSGDQVMLQQMSELSPRWTRWRRENSLAAALRTSARLRNSMVALTKCMVTADYSYNVENALNRDKTKNRKISQETLGII